MAVSARRISVASSSPSSGKTAMPMLKETCRLAPPIRYGCATPTRMWRATSAASSAVPICGSSTTNSSPPSRQTVSLARTAPSTLPATWRSSSSPTSWPCRSLICLKWSRSRNISARQPPLRRASCSACCRRSWSSRRLGRPVSGSCWAWRASVRASSCAVVVSWKVATAPISAPLSGSRIGVIVSRMTRLLPSRCCSREAWPLTQCPSRRQDSTGSSSGSPLSRSRRCTTVP